MEVHDICSIKIDSVYNQSLLLVHICFHKASESCRCLTSLLFTNMSLVLRQGLLSSFTDYKLINNPTYPN